MYRGELEGGKLAETLLDETTITSRLSRIGTWKRKGSSITKRVEHADVVYAMGYANEVALLAERMNHHPDIDIRWNRVTLILSTHRAWGLTDLDFTLAEAIDAL